MTETADMKARAHQQTFIQNLSKGILFGLFSRLKRGSLVVSLPDGDQRAYGDPNSHQKAFISVLDHRFFSRTVFGGEVGFGESYTAGEWETPDLTSVIRLFIENQDVVSDDRLITTWLSLSIQRANRWLHKNTRPGAKRNIKAHYDLSNEFFKMFLDESMTYSCGLYLSPEDSLPTAQQNKLSSIIRKACIAPTDHVLDIGCGWGSFALEAVKKTGCRVTGITISDGQFELARERVRAAGLQDRIDIVLADYRNFQGRFDKIVSIEMLEAAGHDYLGTFFACCDRLLKPNGLLVLQVITYPDQEYDSYRKGYGWVPKHIFPGSVLPSITVLCRSMTEHSGFTVEDLENVGKHYARTLREWRERFLCSQREQAQKGIEEDFRRKWIYYLSSCEAGFATGKLKDMQLVLTRIHSRDLLQIRSQHPCTRSQS